MFVSKFLNDFKRTTVYSVEIFNNKFQKLIVTQHAPVGKFLEQIKKKTTSRGEITYCSSGKILGSFPEIYCAILNLLMLSSFFGVSMGRHIIGCFPLKIDVKQLRHPTIALFVVSIPRFIREKQFQISISILGSFLLLCLYLIYLTHVF